MALVADNVSLIYSREEPDAVIALDGVSLSIAEGEFVIVAGRSGSGKSTLLRCLAGLMKPTSGRVMLDAVDAVKARKLIGFAVQFPERALFEKTLYDDVAFGPRNAGASESEARRIAGDAIKAMGLDAALLQAPPRSLSHGQKRLAALAGVIAVKPKYLFLDEPTAGLDAEGRRRVVDALSALNGAGTTIVAATHSLAHFSGIPARLVVLDAGKVGFDGRPEGLALVDSPESLGLALPPSLTLARELRKRGVAVAWDASPETMAEMMGRARESHN